MKLVIAILAVWFSAAGFKLTGFCFLEFKWKTDQEIIEAAYGLNGWSRIGSTKSSEAGEIPIPPPGFCSVSREGDVLDASFLNALFMRRFFEVRIRYISPGYEEFLIIDCCGKQIVDRYGMETSGS